MLIYTDQDSSAGSKGAVYHLRVRFAQDGVLIRTRTSLAAVLLSFLWEWTECWGLRRECTWRECTWRECTWRGD